jgi:hypothetical protein
MPCIKYLLCQPAQSRKTQRAIEWRKQRPNVLAIYITDNRRGDADQLCNRIDSSFIKLHSDSSNKDRSILPEDIVRRVIDGDYKDLIVLNNKHQLLKLRKVVDLLSESNHPMVVIQDEFDVTQLFLKYFGNSLDQFDALLQVSATPLIENKYVKYYRDRPIIIEDTNYDEKAHSNIRNMRWIKVDKSVSVCYDDEFPKLLDAMISHPSFGNNSNIFVPSDYRKASHKWTAERLQEKGIVSLTINGDGYCLYLNKDIPNVFINKKKRSICLKHTRLPCGKPECINCCPTDLDVVVNLKKRYAAGHPFAIVGNMSIGRSRTLNSKDHIITHELVSKEACCSGWGRCNEDVILNRAYQIISRPNHNYGAGLANNTFIFYSDEDFKSSMFQIENASVDIHEYRGQSMDYKEVNEFSKRARTTVNEEVFNEPVVKRPKSESKKYIPLICELDNDMTEKILIRVMAGENVNPIIEDWLNRQFEYITALSEGFVLHGKGRHTVSDMSSIESKKYAQDSFKKWQAKKETGLFGIGRFTGKKMVFIADLREGYRHVLVLREERE